jgi:hypothetical protein
MNVEFASDSCFIDYIPIEQCGKLSAEVCHRRTVKIVSGNSAKATAKSGVGLCLLTRGPMAHVKRNAVPLRWLKFLAVFGWRQFINGNFGFLAVNFQIEPVLEKRLHHGSTHHFDSFRMFRRGRDCIAVRLDPRRTTFNVLAEQSEGGRKLSVPTERQRFTVRKSIIGVLYKVRYCLTFQVEPPRRAFDRG